MKSHSVPILLSAVAALSCAPSSFPGAESVSPNDSWHRVTPRGYKVEQPPFLCLDQYGLHHGNAVTVYLNRRALQSFNAGGPFLPGSMVVKVHAPLSQEGNSGDIAYLGVMHKRWIGFDREGGDWEYSVRVSDQAYPLDFVPTEDCRSCHSGARDTDYVFLPYLR